MLVTDLESDDTKDSDVEPKSSKSTDSNTETELSDSTQSGSSEYLTCEEGLCHTRHSSTQLNPITYGMSQ